MHLDESEIHIYAAPLNLPPSQIQQLRSLLSQDEQARADRFVFPLHQQRFIAAHGILRIILGTYLNTSPADLQFDYSEHRKPSLAGAQVKNLFFNLSHSDDLAVYAITRSGELGIDVEKIATKNNSDIAERFFSNSEIAALAALPSAQQVAGFFQLWSRKEAIIKANGRGFSQPLSSFSVSLNDQPEIVLVDNKHWILIPLAIDPAFASALAVAVPASRLCLWDFIDQNAVFRSAINLA